MKKLRTVLWWVISALLVVAGPAMAHNMPDSFLQLTLEDNTLRGTWDLPLFSLARLKGIEDKPAREIREFALAQLSISTGEGPCKVQIDQAAQSEGVDEFPQFLYIMAVCPNDIAKLTVDYFSLLVMDPQFRGFINIDANGETYTSALSQQNPYVTFQISTEPTGKAEITPPDRLQQFKDYLREGVWHIWLGYDHILFLITLLLTAGFVRQARHWEPRRGLKLTFWQVSKIVTSFTLAHSITLSLVIFGFVSLPSQLVESTIALSIAIAALNNLYPVIHKRLWLLTFCFGLIHGMGFASALQDLGLPDSARWLALVGFNLGVETGQLAIVAVVLPVIYFLRNKDAYRKRVLPAGSCVIMAVALIWFIQRAFGVSLLGGMLGG